jgi:Gpi18-like mannosyltransferase
MVNFSFNKRQTVILAVLLIGAFIVRVLLFPLEGDKFDTNTFLSWYSAAAQYGVRPFYNVIYCNYPPFNVYIFWAFGSLANAVSTLGINAVNLVKLAPTLFDLSTAALIYVYLRKQLTFKQSIVGIALYAFNPAVIYNTAVWGQWDAIYTFFLVLSLMLALKSKPKLSAVAFAFGLLTKPQGIALAPLVVYLIYRKNGLKNLLSSIAVFAATIFAVIFPFEWSNPVTFLTTNYFGALNSFQYTTVNAFNLWALNGLWVGDDKFFIVGWAMFGTFSVFTIYWLHKRFHVSSELLAVFCAFMLFFAFFMLPTRIHERYLFPAISMLALMFPLIKVARPFYVVLTGTLLVNQAYVLYYLHLGFSAIPIADLVVLAVSETNLIMLLFASKIMWDELKGRQWLKTVTVKLRQDQPRGEPTNTLD